MLNDLRQKKRFLKKNKKKDEVTVWKLYHICPDGKVEPVLYPMVNLKPITPGCIQSHRSTKAWENCRDKFYIYEGIHVFLTRKAVRKYKKDHFDSECQVFKCTAKIEDLVAVGVGKFKQAVFMKIYISPEEFEEGKKGRN